MTADQPEEDVPDANRRRAEDDESEGARSDAHDRTTATEQRTIDSLTGKLEAELRTLLTDWPTSVAERLDLSGAEPVESGDLPASGSLLLYVHGYLGEGRLSTARMSGAHQAAALREGLREAFALRAGDPPTVVAGMWNSSTTWFQAKRRADAAGVRLARWLGANGDRYESVTVLGHSLGARVVLAALGDLGENDVTSVGLLGAAVDPDSVCHRYKEGIETAVEGRCYNYYSTNDRIVCRLYRLGEFRAGLGCGGSDCTGGWLRQGGYPPTNFVDVDVSESVRDHLAYYKPADAVATGGSCLDEIIANQLLGT